MSSVKAQQAGACIMPLVEIREWIRFACECNGCPEIADNIRIVWSNRLKRSMGNCGRDRQSGLGRSWRIKLSVPIFERAGSEERYKVIVHEACHAIDDYINGRMDPIANGHGPKWQRIMRNCGIEPERYHSIDTSGLVNKHVYVCPNCDKEFRLSTRLHNSSMRGRRRICIKCNVVIRYTGISGKGV